ncbi:BMC domain-containing protein [Myxococcota bacterium]|nr:BMC domain-containing protein [Myxococcota bacterium]
MTIVVRPSLDPLVADRPAIACLELATIARGIVVLDQMAKRAETKIVAARTISPGRYLILLSGTVAEVEEAVDAGLDWAKEDLVDHVVIRDPADALRDALKSAPEPAFGESLMIIETATVTTALLAADRTLKGAEVRLLELRLGAGLGGKGLFTLTGELHMIEAAKDILEAAVPMERVVRVELIAQPHPDLPKHLLEAEHPYPRGP